MDVNKFFTSVPVLHDKVIVRMELSASFLPPFLHRPSFVYGKAAHPLNSPSLPVNLREETG